MNKKILTIIGSILIMSLSIFGLSKAVFAKEVAYLSASSANTWLAASVKEMDAVASANGINITESIVIENTHKIITTINCFPNPASSFVNLEFSIENDSKLDISLVDNLGKLVYSNSSLFNSGVNRITLPLDNVSKGIYYIEVRGVDFVERLKLDVLY